MKSNTKKQPLRLSPAAIHDMVMRDDFSPVILSRLSENQKRKVRRFIRARLPHCHMRERKILSARLAMLAPDANANEDTWEYHHANVCTAIASYLHEHGIMPSQAVLSAKTGYNRQTITRHLKAYREHPSYIGQAETMHLMKMKVTEKMLAMALEGDIRAAKVFMETVARTESRKTGPNEADQAEGMAMVQNNFIRINGLFITEEKLSTLDPEKRAQLEALLNPETVQEDVLTLNSENQKDMTLAFEKSMPNGTNVHPNVIANTLNANR